jgi:hypothetical protein
MACRLKGDLAPFVHVCKSCVDFQINEANLLEKDSALLNSTLLFPCSLVCNKKCEIQIANNATALQLYIKGMCRDCDRTQRAMCLDEAARVSPNFREALLYVSQYYYLLHCLF